MSKYFHITKPEDEDAEDKLLKVRPLIMRLQAKLMELDVPIYVSIDEGLVKFTRRLGIKQYMPAKPDKFGIKLWLLPNVDMYYVSRFDVYLGKNRVDNELFLQKALGHYVVWTLGEPYLDCHRHFFYDNFFCPPREVPAESRHIQLFDNTIKSGGLPARSKAAEIGARRD